MKILVTGATGQVGFELRRQLCLMGNVLAPSRQELDLLDAVAMDAWLSEHQPDLIVSAAAYTAVDKAESEPDLARRLNAALPAQLAAYSRARGQWLVHYSSDYVYAGKGENPWQEDDATGPLSVYGQTKLAGDQAIQESGCHHLVFRTSWVYSARANNFMKTMLRLGKERDALRVVNDQLGAPTPARLIALVTQMALDTGISSGIYHLTPSGETSWHGFACEIFRQSRALGETLCMTPDRVAGIATLEYPQPAARPLNSRLCLNKLERALGRKMPSWESQLTLTLAEFLDARGTA